MYGIANKYYISSGYSLSDNQYARFVIPSNEDGTTQQKRTYLNYGNSKNLYVSFFTVQKLFKNFMEMNFSSTINLSTYRVETNKDVLSLSSVSNINYNFSINNTYYLSTKKKWLAFSLLKYYSPIEDISLTRKNVLFSTDFGFRKTIDNLSLSLYFTDIFNTYGKTQTLYHANAAYLYNQMDQNNFNRSVSLNIRYFFGNNKLNLIKNKNIANEELKKRIN
jgi:hypothetical protein